MKFYLRVISLMWVWILKKNMIKLYCLVLEIFLGLKCYYYGYNFVSGYGDSYMCSRDKIFFSNVGKRRIDKFVFLL